MNSCIVKYIHLESINPDSLHTTEDYELSKVDVSHSSYAELEQRVDQHCPDGFDCEQPIALHHEVLWKMMLRKNGKNIVEIDQLFHPMDYRNYHAVQWNTPGFSVCVHMRPKVSLLE